MFPPSDCPKFDRPRSSHQNPLFWQTLVNSDPENKVAKTTAVFAIRALLAQIIGYKGHRLQIDFDHDPITVGGLFEKLEKLCGGSAGWHLAQKLGFSRCVFWCWAISNAGTESNEPADHVVFLMTAKERKQCNPRVYDTAGCLAALADA